MHLSRAKQSFVVRAVLISTSLTCCTHVWAQSPAQVTGGANLTTKHEWSPDIVDHTHWHQSGQMLDPRQHVMRAFSSSGVTLSDDQVERLTSVSRQSMSQMMPTTDRLLLLLPDLKDSLTGTELNDDNIKAIFSKMKAEIDSLYNQAVDFVIATAHVFTADQRHRLRISVDRMELGPLGNPAAPSTTPGNAPGHSESP